MPSPKFQYHVTQIGGQSDVRYGVFSYSESFVRYGVVRYGTVISAGCLT